MKSNIQYVCLSDMHFGDESSLLTAVDSPSGKARTDRPSDVLVNLVECLRFLVSTNTNGVKPELVLNGDILEYALTTEDTALATFQRFLELILPRDGDRLFSRIVYVPGNHDHHIWEIARETQYVEYITQTLPAGAPLPEPRHTTSLIVDDKHPPVPSYLLSRLVQHRLGVTDTPISVSYPNYGVFSDDGSKGVVFSHGHFIEPLYTAMSKLRTFLLPGTSIPDVIYDVEKQNFAWIDFFWSTMGRQSDAVDVVYKRLQDDAARRGLAHNLAEGLAKDKDVGLPGPAWLPTKLKSIPADLVLQSLLQWANGRERAQVDGLTPEEPLGADAKEGLDRYLRGCLLRQIHDHRGAAPKDLAFIFGHTHKPFELDKQLEGYPDWLEVYNTGGWVVETPEPSPLHGAAVVLVDDQLNAASLHMFHDRDRGVDRVIHPVEPRWSTSPQRPWKQLNALQRWVTELDFRRDPWRSFSLASATAIDVRRRGLKATIQKGDRGSASAAQFESEIAGARA